MLPKISNVQTGYIGISVLLFLLLFSLLIYPWPQPMSTSDGECRVGEPPGDPAPILKDLPAIRNMRDEPRLGQPSDLSIGGPEPTEKTDYILVRKNLRIEKNSVTPNWYFFGGNSNQADAHTVNLGEMPEKPGYDAYYPAEWGEIDGVRGANNSDKRVYIRGAGLIFFVNKEPSTIEYTGDNIIYDVDVYQDVRIFNEEREYKTEDLFLCDLQTKVGTKNVIEPKQETGLGKDQLQMFWFRFNQSRIWAVHCKPAVYLYPERKSLVNVRVYPKGELSYTDPPYDNQKGWTVLAEPTGDLYQGSSIKGQEKKYGYLYYESKLLDSEIKKPDEGWVVKGSSIKGQASGEMQDLFDKVLSELGLNEKEKSDFEDYWLSKLPESPYYFVGLVDKDQRDYLERLAVTPQPETSIRFSLYFEPLDQPKQVRAPKITTPRRDGFTLVDWGGMIKLHPGTQFTCSQ